MCNVPLWRDFRLWTSFRIVSNLFNSTSRVPIRVFSVNSFFKDAAHKTTIRARKSRLPFSLSAKFTKTKSRSAAVSSLGLVDGNSTNTMNTVEDDSNTGEKKGVEVTTTFNVAVDVSFDGI